ncbi:hypothetical protein IT401_00595 [Candidatus Nomurabacteria bacterium]|nr:hypothetical protein [Candidatus Nomurabacteria bacterium]
MVQYPKVTALGSRLLKIIIENFAGYGFQKSEDRFETKNFSVGVVRSWTSRSRIKYSTIPDGNMLGSAVVEMAHHTILRC